MNKVLQTKMAVRTKFYELLPLCLKNAIHIFNTKTKTFLNPVLNIDYIFKIESILFLSSVRICSRRVTKTLSNRSTINSKQLNGEHSVLDSPQEHLLP